ncbi:hypothetical protein BDF22DRAFT_226430 [Syncephalis plumigaleata]|nr:hypothetical protein BDF22DRAFT_226430 [Syncephalis plumigaleata]
MVTTRVPRQAASDASKSASPATSKRASTTTKEQTTPSQSASFNEVAASPLEELRGLWQFAAIVQFFELFRASYQVDDVGTEKIEQAFLDEYNPFLRDIAIQLLKPLTTSRALNNETWAQLIRNEFIKRDPEALPATWRVNKTEDSATKSDAQSKLTDEEVSTSTSWNFFDLSLFEKVMTMHYLCEWQFDEPEKFRERVKNDEDAADWRVLPIGYDSKYKTYWLFDDNRLYCQHPLPRPKKASVKAAAQKKKKLTSNGSGVADVEDTEPAWELICSNKEDWLAFTGQFKGTKNRVEKELVQFVNNELLPRIIPEFEAKEKEREKELAILNRKRSSRIIMKEIERAQHQEEQARHRLIEERRQAEKQRIRKENKVSGLMVEMSI